jgi:outer membrane protein assembly factor BamB
MGKVERSLMTSTLTRRAHLGVAVIVALSLLVGTYGPTKAATAATATTTGSWPYANGDLTNTRNAAGSTISLQNVSTLKQAWSFKLKGKAAKSVGGIGSLAAGPIVVNGVVYLQDLHSNVYALSLATGRLKWEFVVNKPEKSGPGPNGVAVVDGTVYGATPTSVFALNATNGQKLWANKKLLKKGQGTIGIQPQVANGRVYLASQYGSGPGGGVLLALNASTGRLLWKFNTVLHNDQGVTSVGLGSGGAWETPLVSSDGSVTYGIGNPYQTAASAIAHPSKLLYTDSDVNLDAATGKLRWYFQGVPDDFKDYDMQASPISTSVNGMPAVLGGGKMGYVYEMNAETGELLWKTPVGKHNGHDKDSLKALHHQSKLTAPYTILPGSLGGILTNMAVDGDSVYVVTCDLAITATSLSQVLGTKAGKPSGEIEALNLTTGKVEWDTKLNGLPLGAATVSNDLVFTTLFQGEVIAVNRDTGAIVFKHKVPNTTNAAIAIAGNTVFVPAGGPKAFGKGGHSQLVAYTLR